jgi:outer membrane receptor protein involved in Fe transport
MYRTLAARRPVHARGFLTLGVLALAAQEALAQTPPPASGATGELQTVTISATRRLEAIRDVPLSLTRLSTDGQLDLGAKDLVDVLAAVPGVSYNQTLGRSGSGDIVIRGVTTGIVTNSTVGIYIDDVPVGGSSGQNRGTSAFDQRLLDLSNIEVLKGPQGTLYGASAMGGLLKYNTRLPDTQFFAGQLGGEASRTSQGGNIYTVYGNVNAPVGAGVAALRAAVFHAKDGGYTDATGPGGGKDVNSGTVSGARLSLGVRPVKGLDIRLSAQQQETKYDGLGVTSYSASSNRPVAGDLVQVGLRYPQPSSQTVNLAALNIEADLGWAKAYSITGYQTQRADDKTDLNDGYLLIFPPFLGINEIDMTSSTRLDKKTQEFRLVSSGAGAFEWLAGLFYADEKSDGATLWKPTLAPTSVFPPGVPLLDNAGIETRWKETAAYATLVWNATPALALTAGARASRNEQEVTNREAGLLVPAPGRKTSSSSESPATYLLAARYKLSASSSVFARAASGYRAGGPNPSFVDPGTGAVTPSKPYESDSLWSYELGYKADLAGGKGSFEVAAFQIDWKDLQVQVASTGAATLGNAGRARVRGVEAGGTFRPVAALTVRGALSLLDAELVDASPELGGKAGDPLPTSPKVAASLSLRHELSLAGAPGFVALNVGHTGRRNVSFDGNAGAPNYRLPAYTTVDINAGAQVAGFDVGLYVRNVGDTRGQVSAYTQFAGLGVPNWVNYIRPRTVGLTASRSF